MLEEDPAGKELVGLGFRASRVTVNILDVRR